ncbi:non-ribosomal peptide synthetase [Paenibacillus bovis]|uniref:Non-ribosomal peptide synthetase n=1 Tax=Paenibacillus bovis TaxID=1616788 RepID=A0A172ZHB8_9BACL|nr:non-ribosomal peptide synthetase [Paenibacillus bovis]ANF97034.1 non-ribosomal peptide synthetase [Paenibacillus bovis]
MANKDNNPGNKNDSRQFWQDYLKGITETSILPQRLITIGPAQDTYTSVPQQQEQISCSMAQELTDSLIEYASSSGIALTTLLQAIWGIVLQKYNNSDDAVFGVMCSDSDQKHGYIEGHGYTEKNEYPAAPLRSILPVRVTTSRTTTFQELCLEIQRAGSLMRSYPFHTLTELQQLADLSHPLVDHVLVFEQGASDDACLADSRADLASSAFVSSAQELMDTRSYTASDRNGDLKLHLDRDLDLDRNWDWENDQPRFVIRISLKQTLHISLTYDPAVYDRDRMQPVCQHIVQIAEAVMQHPNVPVHTLSMLTAAERHQLIHTFHAQATEMPLPAHQTIHEQFEECFRQYPDAVAVIFNGQSLTYRQLNARANQLARVLRRRGAGPEQIIGIMAHHSLEMFVGVLGIIKSGAAYLPIDPSYPVQRTAYMLEDSRTALLLIQPGLPIPDSYTGATILLDASVWAEEEDHNIEPLHDVHHLAYVIYTSGSTGQPKGVMIEHRALINLCSWHNHTFHTSPADRSTKLAGFGFDASVWEMFPPLLAGMTVHIIEERMRGDIYALQSYFAAHEITIAFLPTQLAVQFMELDHPGLRLLLIGGERIQQFKPQSYQVVNNYGPTENTVVTTSGVLDSFSPVLAIGKPVSNHQIWILDHAGQMQPIGVPGELCVSGNGLARGYLHRPELTAERFTPHPLFPEERIYHTGDLACWLPDGQIEYKGRQDEQVKIRGYRIEPGEIDVRLMQHPAVRESLTIARQDQEGYAYLCAYIVSDNTWTMNELREHILHTLPEYMIPAHFIQIDQLPLTANGKVNKSALPEPPAYSSASFVAPATDNEIALAAMFEEILGVPQIGVHDHFFEKGGHSLKAMTLVSRIHREMNIDIPLNEVFLKPTVQELAASIDTAEQSLFYSIPRAPKQTYYPVSSAQRRMYMVQHIQDTATTAYNIPLLFEMKGQLDIPRLNTALQKLIQRHESLRTSFHMIHGQLMQHIHEDISWNMEISETIAADQQRVLLSFIRPFHLSEAPLMRAGLFRLAHDHYLLLLDMHHIISDGVSTSILFEDLLKLYQGEVLPSLPLQYKDYAVWQQSEPGRLKWQEHKRYWLHQLQGELPVIELPADYPRPAVQDYRGDVWKFQLDEELNRKIQQLCLGQGVTLHMLLLAAFHLLLSKYTNQHDMITGAPIAGRSHADIQSIPGMFVNMLAMRTSPESDLPFTDYLAQCKEMIVHAYTHSDYPFEELVEQLGLQRDASRHPLFDVLFAVQNFTRPEFQLPNLDILSVEPGWNPSKFSMNWTVQEGETLDIAIEYSTSLFRDSTIVQMAEHYTELLRQIVAHPQRSNGELNMLSPAEYEQLTITFNQTAASYPGDQCIQELFEQQCRLHPERPAIIMGEQQLTYAELNRQANQLAHALIRRGSQRNPDHTPIIGLITDRSPDMIIAILAILKAGAAYLPIDPTHPAERILRMLSDSEAACVLVQHRQLWADSDRYEGEVLYLSDQPGQTEPVYAPPVTARPEHPAYVMYTSGSTGQPKGVIVTHRNIVKTVINNGFLDITPQDRILQLSNYAFDGSTFDLYGTLLHGAALVLVTREQLLHPVALIDYMRSQQISVALMTVALFNTLVEVNLEGLTGLRKLLFGGEQASRTHVDKAVRTLGEGVLINVYGPTEATVCAAVWPVDRMLLEHGQLPIGRPIHNTSLYILNAAGQPQPIGITGELWIGGEGVSMGYLRRPELTAERFVDNPWIPGTLMYRSGDLARWLPDGNIDYQGRIDEQVKIRGNRIELGEIEAALLEYPSIQETVVIALQKDHSYSSLCAYIVTDAAWTTSELRAHLGVRIPDYMIPSRFISLDQLPLTPNGKVDKRALPVPHIDEDRERVAPRTDTENNLIRLVAEVMEMQPEQISMNDNLFNIGGHSLSILKIIGKAHTIGWKLEMKEFYIYRSFAELAHKIDAGESLPPEAVEPSTFTPGIPVPVPAMSIQKRSNAPQSILLLGATGFLGIHILHELLSTATARITCLIRGENEQQARERLNGKLQFYFASRYGQHTIDHWMSRIHVRHGDMTEHRWGMDDRDMQKLGESVEAVIHTAALVKHYGFYEEFERVNVQGTRYAAEFCRDFHLPLHYVSTLSVSGSYAPESRENLIFTEKDLYIGQDYQSNVYLRSKFEAEALLIEEMRSGLDVSIYRVGNLTGRYTDGQFQENIQENMFYLSLKALAMLGGAEPAIMQERVDLTPVDICAAAIVRLMHTPDIQDYVFHLHNPHDVSYGEICAIWTEYGFRQTAMSREEMKIQQQKLQSTDQMLAGIVTTLFESTEPVNIRIDVQHTLSVLNNIGFTYPVPDKEYFRKMIHYAVQSGFMYSESSIC